MSLARMRFAKPANLSTVCSQNIQILHVDVPSLAIISILGSEKTKVILNMSGCAGTNIASEYYREKQTCDTMRRSHTTLTRHQEDEKAKQPALFFQSR